MKLYNKSPNNFSHTIIEDEKPVLHTLNIGEVKEIPDEIAKIWLKFKGIEKHVDPKDVEELKKENEALKAQVKTQTKTTAKKAQVK